MQGRIVGVHHRFVQRREEFTTAHIHEEGAVVRRGVLTANRLLEPSEQRFVVVGALSPMSVGSARRSAEVLSGRLTRSGSLGTSSRPWHSVGGGSLPNHSTWRPRAQCALTCGQLSGNPCPSTRRHVTARSFGHQVGVEVVQRCPCPSPERRGCEIGFKKASNVSSTVSSRSEGRSTLVVGNGRHAVVGSRSFRCKRSACRWG